MPSRRTVLAATMGVTASLATGGTAHADDTRLRSLISRMTLPEKVGQLFVMRVYGHSATAPDQFERIEVVTHPLAEIPNLILSGAIGHSLVVTAFALMNWQSGK